MEIQRQTARKTRSPRVFVLPPHLVLVNPFIIVYRVVCVLPGVIYSPRRVRNVIPKPARGTGLVLAPRVVRARLADAHATTDISGPVAARHDAVLQGPARLGENIREMPKAVNFAFTVLAPIAIAEVDAAGCVGTSRI